MGPTKTGGGALRGRRAAFPGWAGGGYRGMPGKGEGANHSLVEGRGASGGRGDFGRASPSSKGEKPFENQGPHKKWTMAIGALSGKKRKK